jgi:hypothetical protein
VFFLREEPEQVKKLIADRCLICDECIDLAMRSSRKSFFEGAEVGLLMSAQAASDPQFLTVTSRPEHEALWPPLQPLQCVHEATNPARRPTTTVSNPAKSNILPIGPTGCGDPSRQTLAKMLNVPLVIADATALTEAGYWEVVREHPAETHSGCRLLTRRQRPESSTSTRPIRSPARARTLDHPRRVR